MRNPRPTNNLLKTTPFRPSNQSNPLEPFSFTTAVNPIILLVIVLTAKPAHLELNHLIRLLNLLLISVVRTLIVPLHLLVTRVILPQLNQDSHQLAMRILLHPPTVNNLHFPVRETGECLGVIPRLTNLIMYNHCSPTPLNFPR